MKLEEVSEVVEFGKKLGVDVTFIVRKRFAKMHINGMFITIPRDKEECINIVFAYAIGVTHGQMSAEVTR